MVTSYTLLRILAAKDEEVYRKVKSYPEVTDVILTYGEYDLILKIELGSLEELDTFIFNKLRITEGIQSTTTLIEARPKDLMRES